jgi:hypothetical protein
VKFPKLREDWKKKIEKVIQYENYYLSLQEWVTADSDKYTSESGDMC